jgi:hypothetical protein
LRGKLARVLRRLNDFKVHDKREYLRVKNSSNYEVVEGELVKMDGTMFEVTKDENDKFTPITKRYLYRKTKQELTREKL